MTDPRFEQPQQPTHSDSVDPSAHVDVGSKLIWIVVAIVLAAVGSALSIAHFEPVGCGPLCASPADP